MKNLRASRISAGVIANMFGQAVTVLALMVGVPIFLRAWGVQVYGEWLILSSLPTYLSLSDMGVSSSAGNAMIHQLAKNNNQKAVSIFQSTSIFLLLVIIVGAAFSLLFVTYVKLGRLVPITVIGERHASLVLLFLSIETLIRLYDGINVAVYRSSGEYALGIVIQSATLLLQYVAMWSAALAGLGVVGAAFSFLVVRILAVPINLLFIFHRYRWLEFGYRSADLSVLKDLAKPAMGGISIPIASAVNLQFSLLVIGNVMGAAAAVLYSTTRSVARGINQISYSLNNASEPELALAHGARDEVAFRGIASKSLRWVLVASGAVILLMVFFGPALFSIWTHNSIAFSQALFLSLMLSSFINASWYSIFVPIRSRNGHFRAGLMYLTMNLLAIGFASVLLVNYKSILFFPLTLVACEALIIPKTYSIYKKEI